MPREIQSFWATFPWYDNEWIRDANGEVLRKRDFPFIRIDTVEQLQLRRTSANTFEFTNPAGPVATMASEAALPLHHSDQVYAATRHPTFDAYDRHIVEAGVVGNNRVTTIRGSRREDAASSTNHTSSDEILACAQSWRDPIQFVAASDTAEEDLALLQIARIYMDGHPKVQQGPTMSAATQDDRCNNTARAVVRSCLRVPSRTTEEGLNKLIQRLEGQLVRTPSVSAALQATMTSRLSSKPWGVSSQQHFLWYRLTIGALNVRDREGQRLTCPHGFCTSEGVFQAEHVVWDCTAAKAVWTKVINRWTAGTRPAPTSTTAVRSVFTVGAPTIAPRIRQQLQEISPNDRRIHSTIRQVWVVIVFCATQQLWLMRNQAAFQGAKYSRPEHTATVLAAIRRQLDALSHSLLASHDARERGRLIRALAAAIDVEVEHVEDTFSCGEARLYFDGGSRGNPGHTGAGCVLLERDEADSQWKIVWWDAHYLGDHSTNNVAEHTALLRGLDESQRGYAGTTQHWTIVGDSQLVIAQLNHTARSKHHGLSTLVSRSGAFLRRLPSYDLQHTLRHGNKMVDRLANWAMNHRRSSGMAPYDKELHADLLTYMRTDTTTTWTQAERPNRLLTELRHKYERLLIHRPSRKRRRYESRHVKSTR